MNHVVVTTWNVIAGTAVSSATAVTGVAMTVFGEVNPESIVVTAGGASALLFIWMKVWKDNSATNALRVGLEKQVKSVEDERDEWKLLAEGFRSEATAANMELAILRARFVKEDTP